LFYGLSYSTEAVKELGYFKTPQVSEGLINYNLKAALLEESASMVGGRNSQEERLRSSPTNLQ